ncbi:hypothetical protein [Halomonas sp. 11-S5]|uniref:hypothetical protein n=1 Tax=Halomonas sp. 11-S5 TaxID=2994064 RepID=UPI002469B625|nr:hypothetical protein [Halomonas sp. 11-S5]
MTARRRTLAECSLLSSEALEQAAQAQRLARKADLAASILESGSERRSDGPLFDEEDLALLFAPVA